MRYGVGMLAAAFAIGLSLPVRSQVCVAEVTQQPPESGTGFGTVIDMEGDRLLVTAPFKGAPQGLPTGAAYVFDRSSAGWVQQAVLTPADLEPADFFGQAAALSGDTVLVGNDQDSVVGTFSGSASVFAKVGGAWVEQALLVPDDAAPFDQFGTGVDLEGDTALVGAPGSVSANGAEAYVFERVGTTWSQVARLSPPAGSGNRFGESVALAGDTALVSEPLLSFGSTPSVGAVHLFERSGSTWSFAATLRASDAPLVLRFGTRVAVDGDVLVIGAPHLGSVPPPLDGAAYVFRHTGDAWVEEAKLQPALTSPFDRFGDAVAIAGDRVAVGAYERQNAQGDQSGVVFYYERSGGIWSQTVELMPSNGGDFDDFGRALALDGAELAVGSPGHEHLSGPTSGTTYVYEVAGLTPVVYCTAGVSASGCQALLSASGTPSATAASGFVLSAAGVEGGKDGLFFFGANGRQANPWGNGTSFQCVVPPVMRAGLWTGTGTVGACDGAFVQDLNALWCPVCPKPGHNPGAGSTVQAQLWYRDPLSSGNQTTALSDAIEFCTGP